MCIFEDIRKELERREREQHDKIKADLEKVVPAEELTLSEDGTYRDAEGVWRGNPNIGPDEPTFKYETTHSFDPALEGTWHSPTKAYERLTQSDVDFFRSNLVKGTPFTEGEDYRFLQNEAVTTDASELERPRSYMDAGDGDTDDFEDFNSAYSVNDGSGAYGPDDGS